MKSRKMILIAGTLALCAIVFCLFMYMAPSAGAREDATNEAAEIGVLTYKTADTTTETPTTRLQGKGRQASEKFTLEPGLCIFEIKHDGDSNFIVRLLDENGKEVDTLFNHIGEFKGQRGFEILKAGQYLLDVISNGNWNAEIQQPKPTEASTPGILQGTGYDATEFVRLEKGLNVFKLKYDGQDRFKVTLLDQDGRAIETLVNTLGSFNGSKPVSIEKSGIYFFNVNGDGQWAINVE